MPFFAEMATSKNEVVGLGITVASNFCTAVSANVNAGAPLVYTGAIQPGVQQVK